MNRLSVLVLLIFLFTSCFSLPADSPCSGSPNLLPVGSDLSFVASTSNGKLYQAKSVEPPLNVLHVSGTPYQMGFAHGTLLKTQIQTLVPDVLNYIYSQVDSAIDFLPEWIRKVIEEYGVAAALDAEHLATEAYTPQYFFDEIRGIADGSGVDYDELIQIHMFPELIKASCSMVGASGSAIAKTNGTLYQLRALDWSTDGPFQLFPQVLVYHPDNGHPFSILSWAGFIGAISGYSSAPIGICEKVWLSYNGSDSRFGIPFHFLLRDILQFDKTIDDSLSRIINADRTCSIWIGLGDPVNKFRAVQYSYDYVNIYNDKNFPEYKNHPRMDGLVYVDKHVQPSTNPCLSSLLQQHYGSIDALTMFQHITAELETGNMHIAIYDFATSFMYVSNASPYINGTYTPAYKRPFVQLNMNELFSQKP
eukprot:TRINITY_DN3231_c0_g3_i2.p1 TRINITY_DN3231_c0_g3~~TRINITY_DN3231_c0_g3_i2.p1  ORF type:complete len:430 (-),score=64.57 TRINITY_DN3231_c0_g3_i2:65-1327(-)